MDASRLVLNSERPFFLHRFTVFVRALARLLFWCILSSFVFSAVSQAAAAENQLAETVRAVIPKDFPPTYFIDPKTGQPAGLAIDVMNELARGAGLKVTYQFAEPWDGIEHTVLGGQAELIPFRVINDDTRQHFIFTRTLDASGVHFIRRISDPHATEPAPGNRVGVINNSTAHQKLAERKDVHIIPYESMGHLLMDLITGQLDLIVTVKNNLLELAQTTGLEKNLRVIEPAYLEVVRAIAVRPDREDLRQRLDLAIQNFDGSPAQKRIYEHWLGKPPSWWTAEKVAFILGSGFAVALLLVVFWRFISIRRLNRELEAEKTFLQTMVDAIPELVFYKNCESVYLGCNTSFAQDFIGLPQKQIIGRTDLDVVEDANLAQLFRQKDQEALNSQEPCKYEEWITLADGRRILVETIKTVFHDRTGKPSGVIGIARDITERKLVEEALKESEARYKALHNASFGGIAIHDKGVILACNQGLVEISGHSEAELIGMDGLLLIAPGSRELVMRNIAQGYEKSYEAVGLRKNGEEYPLRLEARNIPYLGKEVRSVEFRDITDAKQAQAERQQLQAQLLQAQKMEAIGTLAGGIAHDFNNILGAILGYAEMAKEDCEPGSNAFQELGIVIEAGNRAASLVKQILAFSRQTGTEPIPLNPVHIIKEAIRLLRSSLPSTITISEQVRNQNQIIIADPAQIHQVVMNLCTNAFHAMETTGGMLTIHLAVSELSEQTVQQYPDVAPGTFLALTVSDTGPGIPPEIRDRIFDPYFTTKEVNKGTGMGLAIVHGIATSCGGCVMCESTLGEGTLFRVYFPVAKTDIITELTMPIGDIMQGREHVLYVDDEKMLAQLGKTMLERLGYQVTVCTDSTAAWSLLCESPDRFDILITDQTMPKMTGIELARNALGVRPDLPIILCTGFSNLVDEKAAAEAGIKGFLLKPVTKKALAELLSQVKKAAEEKIPLSPDWGEKGIDEESSTPCKTEPPKRN